MSSAAEESGNFPTMIIPRGTEVRLNEEGQLSIKTPGNLVIQNSGNYSELESTNGSIRIEENVKVDAITVRAGQACFIQGTLTAWRVNAKKIALEDKARAYIMLQESESLDLSPTSRLVGNFANEKEVYLLLGKFNRQLRQLPGAVGMDMAGPDDDVPQENAARAIEAVTGSPVSPPRASASETGERGGESAASYDAPRAIQQAVALMELEINRHDLDASSKEGLRELLYALRSQDLRRAALIYRDVFSELTIPSENLRRAYEALERHFSENE
jgi:hypothetical protein